MPGYKARKTRRMHRRKPNKIADQRAVISKVETEIQFAKALQSYVPSTWNSKTKLSRNETPKTLQICHLMRLSAEVRLMIYEYLLSNPRTINLHKDKGFGLPVGPGLLRASSMIRQEALPVYFKINSFVLHAPLYDFVGVANWLKIITESCGRFPFGGFRFQVDKGQWSHLHRAGRLMGYLASGTIDLDTSLMGNTDASSSHAPRRESLFMMNENTGSGDMQRALEEASLLAAMARDQIWSRGRFSHQLDVLFTLKMPLLKLDEYNCVKRKLAKKEAKKERRRERRAAERNQQQYA